MNHRLAGVVVALTVILAAAGTLGYRKAYGTWWQTPQRIACCERTYETGSGPALSRAEIERRESKTRPAGR